TTPDRSAKTNRPDRGRYLSPRPLGPDLQQQLIGNLATDDIVAVDPNVVMTMALPVARHPYIIHSARPIARPVEIVRLIANFDVKRNGVRCRRNNAARAEQNRE